jgi:hypothetical protein
MQKRILFILITCVSLALQGLSQTKDSTAAFKIGGYVDAYYAYYTDSVGANHVQQFPVISPKSNQFGLNIAQITASYTSQKVRFVATLHYGDIPASAWSPVYNMIQEANAGVRITKKIWVDAGFFKTHIGTEALLPKDNIASSLSMITFYEPWFQAGVKLSYQPNENLLICLHALNGYNTFVDNNQKKSFGLAVSYAFGDKGSNIGYYNLIGDESPEGTKTNHLRFLNNLVLTYQATTKLKAVVGVDYVTQKNSDLTDSTKSAAVFSAIFTLRYQLKPKFAIYGRYESFSDREGFLTGVQVDAKGKRTGYISNGGTAGIEFKPFENAYIRLEGRYLEMQQDQKIFHNAGSSTNTNSRIEGMVNIGVWF